MENEIKHSEEYYATFGRVDDDRFVKEICSYESEDNYSNRTVFAVLEKRDGGHAIVVQTLEDNPDPEAEWPKARVIFNSMPPCKGGSTEETVIEKAEDKFNKFIGR